MKYFWGIIIAIIVIGGVWYSLARPAAAPTAEQSTEVTTQVPSEKSTNVATDIAAAVQEVVVTGSSFAFDPKEIRVTEGTRVRVVFKNSGGTHDFVLDEFNARTNVLKSGETQTIEFVADKKGTFEYYCSVGEHRQMGMVGRLVVE
jgi:plastocyanin